MRHVSDIDLARASSFRSVIDMFDYRVSSTPDATALLHRSDSGVWVPITWLELQSRVRTLAAALLALGIQRSDRVAIFAQNSVTWITIDLAVMVAGAATTTVFPGDTAQRAHQILADSNSRIVFVDHPDRAQALVDARQALPDLAHIILLDPHKPVDHAVTSYHSLIAQGEAWLCAHPDALADIAASIGPDDLASLLYTSGTMGEPRGVELTHDAWVFEAEAIDKLGVVGPSDVQLLILPLAHVFAKVMEMSFIRLGVPTAVHHEADKLETWITEVRPTWLAGVPRLFERIMNRTQNRIASRGTIAKSAFDAALQLSSKARKTPTPFPSASALHIAAKLADRSVLRSVREGLGGRIRFLVSGGAPLRTDIAEFFDACGIAVCEGYGLTESSAASCVNIPDHNVIGTVGRPVPGMEARLADDGEILLRGRGVMRGYHNAPAATAEAIDADGWLHTGDLGHILPSGHVRITDRKKAILVLDTGKNVAPAHLEALLLTKSTLIAHAIVLGDNRPYCVALLSLDPAAMEAFLSSAGAEIPPPTRTPFHPVIAEHIAQTLEDTNRELAPYERIRAYCIAPEPFSTDNGLLTPSLKVRRGEITSRFAKEIDALYTTGAERGTTLTAPGLIDPL